MKFAIIGAGRIGHVHARSILRHPDAELVLCADPAPGAAQTLAETFGGHATTSGDDAFADANVDAVIVCSPTRFHVDHIIAGVHAGKAVLVEKPVDLNISRVDECLSTIGDAANRVMVGFNRRFDPGVKELSRRMDEGEVGEVRQVTIISRDPAPPPLTYVTQSGGIFRDMSIHDLDMARFLVGDITAVTATGHAWNTGIRHADDYDSATITLSSDTGAIVTIVNSRQCATGYDQRLEVFGTAGSLETLNHRGSNVVSAGSGFSGRSAPYLDFFLERYADAYTDELDQFIRDARDESPTQPNIWDGRAALLLADAATESARTGRSVSIDPSA